MEEKGNFFEGGNKLGKNFRSGFFCVIKNVSAGDNVSLSNYVNLYGCEIGSDCKIGSFVEIQGGAKIGNDVTISSHSFICDKVHVDDGAWLGHGAVTINDLYPPSRKRTGSEEHWQATYIGKGAIVGSNATLFPVNIGDNAVIGAGAVVKKDVPAGQVWAGNPARYICDSRELEYDNGKPVFGS